MFCYEPPSVVVLPSLLFRRSRRVEMKYTLKQTEAENRNEHAYRYIHLIKCIITSGIFAHHFTCTCSCVNIICNPFLVNQKFVSSLAESYVLRVRPSNAMEAVFVGLKLRAHLEV